MTTYLPSKSLRTTNQVVLGSACEAWSPPFDGYCLYRMYGLPDMYPGLNSGNSNLIYVGISQDPVVRLKQHAATKNWFPFVITIVIHEYSTRYDASQAESEAIYTENPLENLNRPGSFLKVELPRTSCAGVLVRVSPNTWATAAFWSDWQGPMGDMMQ